MKFLTNLSIRNKFILTVITIIALSLLVGETIDYYFEKRRTLNIIIENTMLDAKLIRDYCVVPLEFDDENAANKTLEKLQSKPNITTAWLFTSSFNLFASYNIEENLNENVIQLLANQNYAIVNDAIYVKTKVTYNDKLYGHLYIKAYSNIDKISKTRISFSIVLMIVMLLIAFVLSSLFQKFITFPIVKLTKFTQSISSNPNYSRRISKIYNDEVGQLYDEFNFMLNTIQKANSELEQHHIHLEDLVQTRTQALRTTNEKLIKAKTEAEKANLIKSEFLSNMSHELRTPLNGIMGYAQILKTMGKLESKQLEQVEIIHSSGKHLLSLINEILDYSKIEAQKLELAISNFSFTDLIRHVLNIIRIRAEQKDLLLEFDKQSEIPDFVKGDEIKIRQILINLLSNAVKYTKVGKVKLQIKFDETQKQNLNIVVEDTGIGIPNDQIDRIFDPFTQVDNNVKFIEGTGLGLAITRKLIELMDGNLTVESNINIGSKFKVSLNLPVVEDIPQNQENKRNIIGYRGPKITILAVDDNLTNLSVLIATLEPLGFNLVTAQNGSEAVEQYKAFNPDLILMDFVMPEKNGIEAINEIKTLEGSQNTKVIGITASVIERNDRIKFISACHGHINKPIDINELFNLIQQVLTLEWMLEQDFENEKSEANEFVVDDATTPNPKILNEIIEHADIGDFSSIERLLSDLFTTDQNYYFFNKKVQAFIDRYDSEKLIAYINDLK